MQSETIAVTLEGITQRFGRLDQPRCDWDRRHALVAEGGFGFLGPTASADPGAAVTREGLEAALRTVDPIKKYRPVAAEPCVLRCPLAGA